MLGNIVKNYFGRNVMRNFVRNGSHGGIPGENLPFDINNRARLTFNFFWFSLTGIGAPFLIVMHQMKKKTMFSFTIPIPIKIGQVVFKIVTGLTDRQTNISKMVIIGSLKI